MFIKVTEYINPYKIEKRNEVRDVYINVNNIEYIKYITEMVASEGFVCEYTDIVTKDNYFYCRESIDEILKLVEEARNSTGEGYKRMVKKLNKLVSLEMAVQNLISENIAVEKYLSDHPSGYAILQLVGKRP